MTNRSNNLQIILGELIQHTLMGAERNIGEELINETQRMPTYRQIIQQSMAQEEKYKNVINEDGENKLEKRIYNINSGYDNKCAITMTKFEEGEEIIVLPCKHCFDEESITRWLREEKAECPVCRYSFPSKEIKNENIIENDNLNTLEESMMRIYGTNRVENNENNENNEDNENRRVRLPNLIDTIMERIVENEEERMLNRAIMDSLRQE